MLITEYCVITRYCVLQYLNQKGVFYPINPENKFTKYCEAIAEQ
jgi:hypothetical protein